MKIKLLMACLLSFVSVTTFAQKGELNNAQNAYNDYLVTRADKSALLVTKSTKSINDAKTAIDKASTNEKTAALPLTFALKGAIYSALALRDTVETTSAPLFTIADEAVKKAKELDSKGENKKLITDASLNLAQYELNLGVNAYQHTKYDQAYKYFDYYRQVLPDDTNAIYYTAISARNAALKDPKYFPIVIGHYNKLLTTNYVEKNKIYYDLSNVYLYAKDTVNTLKTLAEGVAKYPNDNDLRKREIEISLVIGKVGDIQDKIQAAIANDPKNKTLYYYDALTYSQIGDAADVSSEKAKDAASKSSLHQKALDNYSKAAELYKKALAIDPDYFDATVNLGYVLIKPAIDAYNAANKLPANKQKEYNDAVAKANVQFEIAKPYLQKAVDLNPKSLDALTNLRNYYRGKVDPAHQAENNAKAAALKKQIDALPAPAEVK